jgi:hypothetical protein
MKRIVAALLLLTACSSAPQEQPVRKREVKNAIADGVAFLVRTQNKNGSWGRGAETRGLELYSMVPGSHDAFRVATTSLCVMALREAGEKEAHARGLEYLVTEGWARRDDGTLLYNVWANFYALQCMAIEMRHSGDPRIRKMAEWHLKKLEAYESYNGGWFYYDFDAHGQNPSEGPASFSTAAGLVALWEARQSGLDVPQKLVERAMSRMHDMRLPDGNFLYGYYLRFYPQHPINKTQGSVGRNQSCNVAMWLWGSKKVGEAEARKGLEEMLTRRYQMFMEIGRKRPWPHEAWYATSGYFYYFGTYYGALIIDRMGPEAKRKYGKELADEMILPYQEADGSWWDYAMWGYHKPYGTAYALLTLLKSRPPE